MRKELMCIAPEVADALVLSRPVVALESTVIAHGLPRPLNIETALRVEALVRAAGAVPATIALLDGIVSIGLDQNQLAQIATRDDIVKLSLRDLPVAVARRQCGATTVAATMWAAAHAGIAVFATGGIGGVHRGPVPDVSADLVELGRNPMVVVCAGAKIVLDLPATREWLETHGVTVLGYRCDEMPAFYSRSSGLPIDARVDSATEIAAVHSARQQLGLCAATLVTVPVPLEFEVPMPEVESALTQALIQSVDLGVQGKALTPFLLARLAALTDGSSLRANLALLEQNATVAAEVACALAGA